MYIPYYYCWLLLFANYNLRYIVKTQCWCVCNWYQSLCIYIPYKLEWDVGISNFQTNTRNQWVTGNNTCVRVTGTTMYDYVWLEVIPLQLLMVSCKLYRYTTIYIYTMVCSYDSNYRCWSLSKDNPQDNQWQPYRKVTCLYHNHP